MRSPRKHISVNSKTYIQKYYQDIITYYNEKKILKKYILRDIDPKGYQKNDESYQILGTGKNFSSLPFDNNNNYDANFTWFEAVRNIDTLNRIGELIEYGTNDSVFGNPKDKRTEDYVTGRIG